MKYFIIIFILLFTFTGCSRKPVPKPTSHQTTTHSKPKPTKSTTKKNTSSILKKLYKQYYAWECTPYQYGGLSKDGIDCSGFVHQTYKKLFNITLPRQTKSQVTQGKRVYINQLRAGDLVFFKTGWNVRHVGIYLEKGKFVHASSSKGVIISTMHTGYWKKNYWQARRLL